MGTGCSAEMPQTMTLEKSDMKDDHDKMTRTRNRIRKQSTTSSSDINVKVNRPKPWVQPLPTPMPEAIAPTPESSQMTVEDNGARLGVSQHLSASDSLSVSDTSSRCGNALTAMSGSPSISTITSKIRDQWKLPSRLASLSRDMQDILLGQQPDPTKLLPVPKVIHLRLIAPGEESMKERLALWNNVFMPIRIFCAERGYAVDIQDDTWSSGNLERAYTHLLTLQSEDGSLTMEKATEDDENKLENDIDLLVIILANVYGYRLPAVLSHEDYTLVVVSLPDSGVTALFHDLYANNENRSPPAYELKHHVMAKQEEAKLNRLMELMLEVFRKEHRDPYSFQSDYYNHVNKVLSDKALLTNRTIVVSRMGSDDHSSEEKHQHLDKDSPEANVLTSVLDKCPVDNIVRLALQKEKQNEEASDAKNSGLNADALQNMSLGVRELLEGLAEKIMSQKDAENREIVTGVPRSLTEELVTQAMHAKRLASVNPILESPTLTSLQDYLLTVSEVPIVTYAEAGWGLSTMGAQLFKSCSVSTPSSIVIYRSMGISPDSRCLMSTLLSIRQQLETILGPVPRYARSKQEAGKVPLVETLLRDIVTRSSAHMPLIIVLEGVSLVSAQLKELDVMTLTESLPATTKLLVMTSDPDVARGLRSKMKDAFYVKATPWEKQSIVSLFNSSMETRKRNLADSQTSAVATALQCTPLPMYAVIAAKLAASWRALTEITDDNLPGSLEEIIGKLFDHLEHCIPSDCFSAMMAYLTGSVGGVSKWEMSDLLSVNDSVLLSIYSDVRDPPIHRAPPILWKFISAYLRDHLNLYVSRDFYSYWWISGSLRKCASARYLSSSVTTTILHREISDHFLGRWANKRKPYPDPEEEIELLQDRFIMPQPDSYGPHLNTRKFMFIPHHLMGSKNKNAYTLETCIFNLQWIERKLNCTSVLQIVCDLEQAKSMETTSATEIRAMQQAILLSSSRLSVHAREIYKCLFDHMISTSQNASIERINTVPAKNNNGLINFYASLSRPPGAFFHPLEEDNVPAQTLPLDGPAPMPDINAIIPLSHDPHDVHVIVVLKSEGELKVLNVVTNAVVRTLTGVDHPQTLKMLSPTTAVVLCNRELLVINLDQGQLVTKLRAVLNLKMPLFGLQNDHRVVALSRDRMVVNIFDISTGAIVASFKAGETRFLDSLIISGDGNVLVCGDETQKPFPLLVWSLTQAKLLHDIRMSHHEFLTQLAAITDNGQYLACGCREVDDTASNFIALYDLTSGHLLKKFKMAALCTALAMSSQTKCVVAALDTGQVAVWDIVSGNRKFLMDGGRAAIDTISLTPDGKMCLTTCKNEQSISSNSLSLWNLQQGHCVACYTFEFPVTSTYLTVDGNMVLAGVKGHLHPVRLLLVAEGSDVISSMKDWEADKDAQCTFGDPARHEKIFTICND